MADCKRNSLSSYVLVFCLVVLTMLCSKGWAADIQSIEGFETQAAAFMEQDKYVQALEVYNAAIAQYPANTQLLNKRGRVYLELGQPVAAQRDFQKVVFMDDENIDGYLGMAVRAACDGDMKDSWDYFDYAIDLNKNNPKAYMLRARYYYQGIGDFEDAIKDYEYAALLSDKDNKAELLHNIMLTYSDYAVYYPVYLVEVLHTADNLLTQKKLSASYEKRAIFYKIDAYKQMGNYEEAFRETQKLMSLLGNDQAGQAYIMSIQSELLIKLNMPMEAKRTMLAALERNPKLTLPRYYESDPLFAQYGDRE